MKGFRDRRAVDGIDLDLPTGSLRLLTTLLRPDAGTARIFGLHVRTQAQAVRAEIGLTGQYASVDEALTATENLVIFARQHGFSRTGARRRAVQLLDEVGLSESGKRPVSAFSGGMRRRPDLAGSLTSRPPPLFLDEPATGLGPRTRNAAWATLRGLVDRGTTVVLATQYLEEADQLADRVSVLDGGRIVASGTPESLKDSLGRSTLRVGSPPRRRPRCVGGAVRPVRARGRTRRRRTVAAGRRSVAGRRRRARPARALGRHQRDLRGAAVAGRGVPDVDRIP